VIPISLKVARLAIIATTGVRNRVRTCERRHRHSVECSGPEGAVGGRPATGSCTCDGACRNARRHQFGDWRVPDLRPQDRGAAWRVPGGSRHRRRLRSAREYPSGGDR
jgi:hypothetical protein